MTKMNRPVKVDQLQKQGKDAREPKDQTARAYPGFLSMKHA